MSAFWCSCVQHRRVSFAGRWPWLCFPVHCFGWAPGWAAWLGLGFLREERVALFCVDAMRAHVRSPGFGEEMLWHAGFSEEMLWGLVIQGWRQLPFGPRLPLVLEVLLLAYL